MSNCTPPVNTPPVPFGEGREREQTLASVILVLIVEQRRRNRNIAKLIDTNPDSIRQCSRTPLIAEPPLSDYPIASKGIIAVNVKEEEGAANGEGVANEEVGVEEGVANEEDDEEEGVANEEDDGEEGVAKDEGTTSGEERVAVGDEDGRVDSEGEKVGEDKTVIIGEEEGVDNGEKDEGVDKKEGESGKDGIKNEEKVHEGMSNCTPPLNAPPVIFGEGREREQTLASAILLLIVEQRRNSLRNRNIANCQSKFVGVKSMSHTLNFND
uniref:Uncharacterized protein n=1 Tax=Amphimedon queenslandica TaxID=400682 RepID=A0A1X7VE35_AMPQE